MERTTRVELHCHSSLTDGGMAPAELADLAAEGHVLACALTDHNSTAGTQALGDALARHGIGAISGVEITAQHEGLEVHILGYGFDAGDADLQAALAQVRASLSDTGGAGTITDAVRQAGDEAASHRVAPPGPISAEAAIGVIQRAGGLAVLAHPLAAQGAPGGLEGLTDRLVGLGLDGIEVWHPTADAPDRQRLLAIAQKRGLLVCGGTDFHGRRPTAVFRLGVDIPDGDWHRFRDAIHSGAKRALRPSPKPSQRPQWRRFAVHIIVPTALALGLFVAALFAIVLPSLKSSLIERKREMVRELTNSAWSILDECAREEQEGLLTRDGAQQEAAARIGHIRYGPEGKDYFWIQDLTPRMVMHPYRPDLNGQDLSGYRDPRGSPIFVIFADVVRERGEGYVEYVWQWHDDPARLKAKESYVRGFEPWGWVIGTGLYVDDVHRDVSRVARHVTHTAVAVAALVALLLLYAVQQSLRIERDRVAAEEGLRESRERYRTLAEAAREGSLLVLDGRCRYANPILQDLVGRSAEEVRLLQPDDLLPRIPENAAAWESLRRSTDTGEVVDSFDGVLQRRDGTRVDCLLAVSPISVGERRGFVLSVKSTALELHDLAGVTGDDRLRRVLGMADSLPIGLLRARLSGRGAVVLANARASDLLGAGRRTGGRLLLSSLFPSDEAFAEFAATVASVGFGSTQVRIQDPTGRLRPLRVDAVLAAGEAETRRSMDVAIVDVSDEDEREAMLEAEVSRLQTSLLFLSTPVGDLARDAAFCAPDSSIESVARAMASAESSAALVRLDAGAVVGIVTTTDIHRRAVAVGREPAEPVHRIMSSPLHTVRRRDGVSEALTLMEERGISHLPVVADDGVIDGIVRCQDLLRFESYGPLVLCRRVERAEDCDRLVEECCMAGRLAQSLLMSGAPAERVARVLSSVCDSAVRRLVELAEPELGPAPAPFAVLALGSHGREELTPTSDQDNAIIYADPEDERGEQQCTAYFVGIGRFLNTWLANAGFEPCRGGIMAGNPKWCQSLRMWTQYYSDWVRSSDPQHTMEFSVFFDLRPVLGDTRLVDRLRNSIRAMVGASESFLPLLARQATAFRPPAEGVLRRLLSGRSEPDAPRSALLKDALSPLVGYARLYALRHGLDHANSLGRLSALADIGAIPEPTCRDISEAFGFLLGQRLRGESPRRLTPLELTQLQQTYALIVAMQERIAYDFLGGVRDEG